MPEPALPLLDLIREHRLNNGIRVFLCPMPGVQIGRAHV